MKIFENISIVDSVDSFCSILGNDLIYEKENTTNLLLPCFNIGFYGNEINQSPITKAVDICYFLFEDIVRSEIELSPYGSIFPDEVGQLNLNGTRFKYSSEFKKRYSEANEYYIEGVCFRNNSFSYGSYKIMAENIKVILLNESKFLNEYILNEEYKKDQNLQLFLLNQEKTRYINQIIKAV